MSEQVQSPELTVQDILMLFQESERKSQESHERFLQEMRESQAAWDRRIEQTNKKINHLSDESDYFAENMVEPYLWVLFERRGIFLKDISLRRRSWRDGAEMYVDLMAANDEYAVVVEVKTRLKQEDVDAHLERLALLKRAFPVYQEKQVLGAVAGMEVADNVAKYAYRHGLFVLAQSGEAMELLNDDAFEPRAW